MLQACRTLCSPLCTDTPLRRFRKPLNCRLSIPQAARCIFVSRQPEFSAILCRCSIPQPGLAATEHFPPSTSASLYVTGCKALLYPLKYDFRAKNKRPKSARENHVHHRGFSSEKQQGRCIGKAVCRPPATEYHSERFKNTKRQEISYDFLPHTVLCGVPRRI